jgi:hypothetical protein
MQTSGPGHLKVREANGAVEISDLRRLVDRSRREEVAKYSKGREVPGMGFGSTLDPCACATAGIQSSELRTTSVAPTAVIMKWWRDIMARSQK